MLPIYEGKRASGSIRLDASAQVVGDDDRAIPARAFPRAAAWFTGPYRLVTVPRAGHFVQEHGEAIARQAVVYFRF